MNKANTKQTKKLREHRVGTFVTEVFSSYSFERELKILESI
jgi:hypothetical protein